MHVRSARDLGSVHKISDFLSQILSFLGFLLHFLVPEVTSKFGPLILQSRNVEGVVVTFCLPCLAQTAGLETKWKLTQRLTPCHSFLPLIGSDPESAYLGYSLVLTDSCFYILPRVYMKQCQLLASGLVGVEDMRGTT